MPSETKLKSSEKVPFRVLIHLTAKILAGFVDRLAC